MAVRMMSLLAALSLVCVFSVSPTRALPNYRVVQMEQTAGGKITS